MQPGAEPAFAVMVLAAGAGRRMGRLKAAAPWRGGTLLDDAIRRARKLDVPVHVLVGAGYPLVRFRCAAVPGRWCVVNDWQEGMAASLREGLRRMPVAVKGVLVMPVDQPLIPVAHLRRLLAQAEANPEQPVATQARGRVMAPAYLPRALWPELMALRGDRGARDLLRARRATPVSCERAGFDLDTWQALRRSDPDLVSPPARQARQCLRRRPRG